MGNKLFKDKDTIEEIDEIINEYMEKELSNLENKSMLEKWNYFSVINLEDEKSKNKLLEFVHYIDEIVEDNTKKISEILTLGYLLLKEKVDIDNIDNNSMFLVVNYLEDKDINLVGKYTKFLLNEKLLYQIRLKTLDIEVRVKILDYVLKTFRTVKEMLDFIETKEYYDMLEIIS